MLHLYWVVVLELGMLGSTNNTNTRHGVRRLSAIPPFAYLSRQKVGSGVLGAFQLSLLEPRDGLAAGSPMLRCLACEPGKEGPLVRIYRKRA